MEVVGTNTPQLDKPQEPPAKPNTVSKARNSGYLVAANAVAYLLQFLSVPFTIRWLGIAGYGVYTILYAITNAVIIASPNVMAASQKRITEAFHENDIPRAWQIQRTQLYLGVAAILLGLPLFVLLGIFYHLPHSNVSQLTVLWMCLAAAWAFGMALLNSTLVSVLAALEKFQLLAMRLTVERVASTTVGLVLAYFWRSPIALFVGWAVGGTIGLGTNLWSLRRAFPDIPIRPKLDQAIMRDLLKLFFLSYPHRLLAGLGGPIDRVVMPYGGATTSMVGQYNAAYRLPEAINLMLYPVTDTVVPDLTRKVASDPIAFGRSLDRQARVCLWLSTCFILVPCSFGAPFLKVYLHGMASASGYIVMLAIGFNYTVQFYIALLTKPFFARGNLQYATVFSGFNFFATMFGTIPAFKLGGIAGVAVMNALIAFIQFWPYPAFVKRFAVEHFPVVNHMLKSSAILLIACLFAVAGLVISHTLFANAHPWLTLILAPVLSVGAASLIANLKLVELPEDFRRRILKLTGR